MATSSEILGDIDPDRSSSKKLFSIDGPLNETGRSMRLLERLASTLGMPVDRFFVEAEASEMSDGATSDEIASLTQAFVAIADPMMRRYCLDVVRAAGAKEIDDGSAPASL